MALAAARPAVIRGAVLNDVGPVIDARGLLRIRGYVGKLPMPRSFSEGAEILKRLSDQHFPVLSEAEWEVMARRTWTDRDGALRPDYDTKLMKVLEELDLETPLPVLWTYFDGLKAVPLLAIRGANSDLLAEKTLQDMAERHSDCEIYTAPGQGHAPAARLEGDDPAHRQADCPGRAVRGLNRFRISRCPALVSPSSKAATLSRPAEPSSREVSTSPRLGAGGEFRLPACRKHLCLADPVLALDAAGKGEITADPFDVLSGPGGDLLEMPDAEAMQPTLVLAADTLDQLEIVGLVVAGRREA